MGFCFRRNASYRCGTEIARSGLGGILFSSIFRSFRLFNYRFEFAFSDRRFEGGGGSATSCPSNL